MSSLAFKFPCLGIRFRPLVQALLLLFLFSRADVKSAAVYGSWRSWVPWKHGEVVGNDDAVKDCFQESGAHTSCNVQGSPLGECRQRQESSSKPGRRSHSPPRREPQADISSDVSSFDFEAFGALASSGKAPGDELLHNSGQCREGKEAPAVQPNLGGHQLSPETWEKQVVGGGGGTPLAKATGLSSGQTALQLEGGRRGCWLTAYMDLMSSCRDVLSNDTRKAQLSLRLTNCFLEGSGRKAVTCSKKALEDGEVAAVQKCLESLTDHQHSVYLAFFIDCPGMCHYLQSDMFKREVEASVNSLKSTAVWLRKELNMVSDSTEDILSTSKQSLRMQQLFLVQQDQAGKILERVTGGIGNLQRSLETANVQQTKIADDMSKKLDGLSSGAEELGVYMEDSLKRQHDLAASQASAAEALKLLQEDQASLAQQHKADLQEIFRLAWEQQHNTAAWHARMHELQEQILSGQGAVEDELRRAQEEHMAAAQEHSKVMGDLAAGTVQYHRDAVAWQDETRRLQEESLMGQAELAKGIKDVVWDAAQHHRQEIEWNLRMEELQHQMADKARDIVQRQDAFSRDHGALLGRVERVLSVQRVLLGEAWLLRAGVFYGAAAFATWLLTCTTRTASARLPLLIVLALSVSTEWYLHDWAMPWKSPAGNAGHAEAAEELGGMPSHMLIACRALYSVVASAILTFYAITYRNLTAASHSLLQRQNEHFQALLLALQEVAQNFRAPEQEQQGVNASHFIEPRSPPQLLRFTPGSGLQPSVAQQEAPRENLQQEQPYQHQHQQQHQRQHQHQQQHQQQQRLQEVMQSPVAAHSQPLSSLYEWYSPDVSNEGRGACSPGLPAVERDAVTSMFGTSKFMGVESGMGNGEMRENAQAVFVGASSKFPAGPASSSNVPGCPRPASRCSGKGHPDTNDQGPSRHHHRSSSSSTSSESVDQGGLNNIAGDQGDSRTLRRSPRILERAKQQEREQQGGKNHLHKSGAGASTRLARAAVKRAVDNCRRRGLARDLGGVTSGGEDLGATSSTSWLQQLSVLGSSDGDSDETYIPPVSDASNCIGQRKFYDLRPQRQVQYT